VNTVAVLRDVRERLADPRRWLQGRWCAYLTASGQRKPVPEHKLANCWCLGGAITVSIASAIIRPGMATFTELRSDVERELLETLGEPLPAIYMFNDRPSTSHADVLELIDRTIERLAA
jgi:hypothetical protein